MEINLTQGKKVIIDDEDFYKIEDLKWYANRIQGIWYAVSGGRLMHRIIALATEGEIVDHKDGNGLNNKKDNLRICTTSQNLANSNARGGKNRTSKYKGVTWHSRDKKWYGRAYYNREKFWLGHFDSEIECAKAVDKKNKRLYGEFCRLNIKDSEVSDEKN